MNTKTKRTDTMKGGEWRRDLRRACATLPALLAVAEDIDALDDVARGFGETEERRRVEAARAALGRGLRHVMPELEHCVRLASLAMTGPDPEWAVFDLLGGLGDVAGSLAATARSARAKVGKAPPAARVAAGFRMWKSRARAERERDEQTLAAAERRAA